MFLTESSSSRTIDSSKKINKKEKFWIFSLYKARKTENHKNTLQQGLFSLDWIKQTTRKITITHKQWFSIYSLNAREREEERTDKETHRSDFFVVPFVILCVCVSFLCTFVYIHLIKACSQRRYAVWIMLLLCSQRISLSLIICSISGLFLLYLGFVASSVFLYALCSPIIALLRFSISFERL